MALKAGREGVASSQVDYQGRIRGLDIPIATPSKAGTVKPVVKTEGMTQDVGIDSSGKLYTAPSEVRPVGKTTSMTQDVGVDSTGKLFTVPSTNISVDLLCDESTLDTTTDVVLAHPISDYNFILVIGFGTYTGLPTYCSNLYVASALSVDDGFGVCNDANVLWYKIKDMSTIIGSVINMPATRGFKVYGIKF